MDVDWTEEQDMLREAARDFLAQECPMSLVRAAMETPESVPTRLWKQMAELGWMGLGIEERYGGAGRDLVDLSILLDEMGRVLLPAPYLSTAVAAAAGLRIAGDDAQKRRWLPAIAAGDARWAVALLEDGAVDGLDGIGTEVVARGSSLRLCGRKRFVPDAHVADFLLVAARLADGIALVVVPSSCEGVAIRRLAFNDPIRHVSEVGFDDVTLDADALLADSVSGRAAVVRLLDEARAGLCAEMIGGAQRMLEESVAYAKAREQFGQAIGRFQAIQHKCADMLVETEGIRSSAWYAAWALANDAEDAHTAACLAKAFCSEACVSVAAEAIQIHGGLGFTWEQDLHLYFKRAQASLAWLGAPTLCREEAAARLLDGA